MAQSGKWLTTMNITVPASVTRKDQVKSQSAKGCIIMTTPSAIRTEATISQGPRRRRARPCEEAGHLRTAPKVMPRSRCLRSRMVKTMTGSRKSVAPAATAGQSWPPTPMIVGMKGGAVWAVARGQEHGEGVLVPGEDQAEDRGRGDAGRRLRQHHLPERLEAGVAVDQRRLLVLDAGSRR